MISKVRKIFGFIQKLKKRIVYDYYGKILSSNPACKSLD